MDKYNIFLQGSEMTAEVWQNTAAKDQHLQCILLISLALKKAPMVG